MSAPPPGLRVRRAVALAAGALVLEVLVARGSLAFTWTPLVAGTAYLLAATGGGREGGMWATAAVLVGWGAAVAFVAEAEPELDRSGTYLLGAGLGAVGAAVLERAGFAVTTLGVAATVAAAGALLAFTPQIGELGDATTYAVLLAGVAAVNVVLAARRA